MIEENLYLCIMAVAVSECYINAIQDKNTTFFQMQEIPQDFFVDIISQNNFLVRSLTNLFENIRDIQQDSFTFQISHLKTRKTIQNTPFQQHTIFSNKEVLWGGFLFLFLYNFFFNLNNRYFAC